MTAAFLVSAFLFGLLGSGHCAGMCGPLVLAAAQRHRTARELQIHQALYHVGKTLAYAALGAAVGAVAGLAGDGLAAVAQSGQRILSVALGLGLVALGVALLAGRRLPEGSAWAFRLPVFGVVFRALVQERALPASVGLGFLNGLLPCGLVYAGLGVAATTGLAGGGALSMAAFGLGTAPALVAVGTFGYAARPAWRSRMQRAAGALLVVAGLPTLLRATPAWGAILHSILGH